LFAKKSLQRMANIAPLLNPSFVTRAGPFGSHGPITPIPAEAENNSIMVTGGLRTRPGFHPRLPYKNIVTPA
jgi:hypothetical protein